MIPLTSAHSSPKLSMRWPNGSSSKVGKDDTRLCKKAGPSWIWRVSPFLSVASHTRRPHGATHRVHNGESIMTVAAQAQGVSQDQRRHDKYDRLVAAAQALPTLKVAWCTHAMRPPSVRSSRPRGSA